MRVGVDRAEVGARCRCRRCKGLRVQESGGKEREAEWKGGRARWKIKASLRGGAMVLGGTRFGAGRSALRGCAGLQWKRRAAAAAELAISVQWLAARAWGLPAGALQ